VRAALLCLALASLPALAQDPDRGKLVYETHCGGCHYPRVHEREPAQRTVRTMTELRDTVALRAGQTGRPFTREDLEDLVQYLNRDFYKFEN